MQPKTQCTFRPELQIALRYLIDGLQVGVDEIVVTNGALEALSLCLSAVCVPGDAVVVESPCFYACLQALEQSNQDAGVLDNLAHVDTYRLFADRSGGGRLGFHAW